MTSPRTMKTTSLTSNCLQSFIPKQVSQSTGQDLVAFQVHPAALPRKFQQYFKFDRPSSLIQQEKPPGHKFTLAQGLVYFILQHAKHFGSVLLTEFVNLLCRLSVVHFFSKTKFKRECTSLNISLQFLM